jgi:hypothetical protein
MKKNVGLLLPFFFFLLSSCQAIGDIFKAGVWVGVLIVLGVLALIIYLITRGSGKN